MKNLLGSVFLTMLHEGNNMDVEFWVCMECRKNGRYDVFAEYYRKKCPSCGSGNVRKRWW